MEETLKKHTLGICAMEKKIRSPHMRQILDAIDRFNDFDLIEFTEELIFNEDIENWPIVESMIVFFSTGFPYSKVLEYINLRKPFLPNDFGMQKIFWDRIKVMKMLEENGIPIPKEIKIERNNEADKEIELNTAEDLEEMIKKYHERYGTKDKPKAPVMNEESLDLKKTESHPNKLDEVEEIITKNEKGEEVVNRLEEYDEYIVYNGEKIMKPFVEKPVNGDDHNIYIYYPMSHGGGQTRLFRKYNDLSSLYYQNENRIRRNKSYIYEEYLQTDGFDIKVYTVGENYAHAEARKSPYLDGKVERLEGKEVRYPVNLNPQEKEIAKKIVNIFKQNVCGFDILRSKGQSYVCDVNGWSFVKGNKKYYQDCAILLRKIILSNIDPERLVKHPINITNVPNVPVYKELNLGSQKEELLSVVAVFRHADRSPKQKMKLVVDHPSLLKLFDIFKDNEHPDKIPEELKLKKPNELLTVLNIVNDILSKKGIKDTIYNYKLENFDIKLFQIKLILEKNLNFEGLTRKIQIRPLDYKEIEENGKKKLVITKALMIMKWGGHITHSGIEQAKKLGTMFRYMFYPSANNNGEGLLRLHNTYRHDLKCYSSEEGRCLKSAAAFLQGLLQLEGNLIPIITSMVWKNDEINKLLDVNGSNIEPFRKEVKTNLNEFCNYNGVLKEKYLNFIGNEQRKEHEPFIKLTEDIGNFQNKMVLVKELLDEISNQLEEKLGENNEGGIYFIQYKKSLLSRCNSEVIKQIKKKDDPFIEKSKESKEKDSKLNKKVKTDILEEDNTKLSEKDTSIKDKEAKPAKGKLIMDCEEENIILIYKRYFKLQNDFYNTKTGKYDISKIPDIYDNIKYDIIHNKALIGETTSKLLKVYELINHLADFVMPLEYGIKIQEKLDIGIKFIQPLVGKIYSDLFSELFPKKNQQINSFNFSYQNLQNLESQEKTYFGLDKEKLEEGVIKSSWRHVKTRFYFTSQSHLYSLLNTLIYSMNSFLVDNSKGINPIWSVFDLDYCSNIIFRLFENYNVDEKAEGRFRIEIRVCSGAQKNLELDENVEHMCKVNDWFVLNDHLNIYDMKKYFDFVLNS